MDPHQYQCSSNGGRSSSFLCRQSSSRWIPTAEQIRILRELYYTNGVRSPTAEQIQRISARLRQYGKIEGKNVFYWFQNHKARERQKKKLTMDTSANNSSNITNTNTTDISAYCISDHNKLSTANSVVNVPYGLSAASHGIYDVGNGYGAGGAPMLMEASIRESRLSGGQGGGDGSAVESNNMPRMLIEPTVPWMYPHYIKEQEEPITAAIRQIETLPLFPTHSEEQEDDQEEEEEEQEQQEKYYSNSNNDYFTPPPTAANGHPPAAYYHHHYAVNGAGAAASLELTLNSYYCAPPGSM